MREFTLGALRTHVKQFARDGRVQHEIPMEEPVGLNSVIITITIATFPQQEARKHALDFFDRLVPPWDALRNATVANIGLRSVIGGGLIKATWSVRH